MTVPDPTRAHLRTGFMQSFVDCGLPHPKPSRNFVDIHPPVVEGTDDLAGETQSMSVRLPAFPCPFGPSEHGHVMWRCHAFRFHLLCNGTAGESRFVESYRISFDLDRMRGHLVHRYGQPVHASSANSLTEQ